MAECKGTIGKPAVIGREGIQALIDALAGDGHQVIGPKVEQGAVVYEPVLSVDDLPGGWIDEQSGGKYRLTKTESPAIFDHVVGPHGWKRWLYPPRQTLFRAERRGKGFAVEALPPSPRYAFIGMRPCEIKAMSIHDRVFDNGDFSDPGYFDRRDDLFVVGVNCGRAGGTCFCVSMNSGPKATCGFDIALTEMVEDGGHEFLVEAGSEKGRDIMARLPSRPAGDADMERAASRIRATENSMGREMPKDAAAVLGRNLEHSRWEEVAGRCLACANCTMVCPTCFCSTVEDLTDLSGNAAERVRRWDSCFTMDFSYIHGGSIRRSGAARYRQWITHKLANWHEQFGTSGCTGCGRCITWCPVGIDITEEVRAIQDSERRT